MTSPPCRGPCSRQGGGAFGPLSGEEGLGQGAQDVPLFRGRVLGLVDQHVLDPAVQLVQHPGRGRAAGQQVGGARHQVGEVQRPPSPLAGLVERRMHPGEGQELLGLVGDAGGADRFQRRRIAVRQPPQPLGRGGRSRLRRQPLARLAAGQEHRLQRREGPALGRRAHPPGALPVGGRAGRHGFGGGEPVVAADPAHEVGLDLGQGPRVGAGEHPRRRGRPGLDAIQIFEQGLAPGLNRVEQGVEGLEVQLDGEMGVGRAHRPVGILQRRPRQLLPRRVRQVARRLVLQHLEAGGDPRLERKAPQQLFAEGVDGLDLQPAGRLQRPGEQPARLRQLRPRQRLRVAALQPGQFARQLAVVGHRPAAQLGEQPRLHLRRRRLGVGDAQDVSRPHPPQQQTRHPVHQGGGLAGPGVGGDEDRQLRVGRGGLVGAGRGGGVDRHDVAHSGASSSPPTTCHSQTRARWS